MPIKNVFQFVPRWVNYSGDTWIVVGFGYDTKGYPIPYAMAGNYVIDKSTGKGTIEWEESKGLHESVPPDTLFSPTPPSCNANFCIMLESDELVITKDHGKNWFYKEVHKAFHPENINCTSKACTIVGVKYGVGLPQPMIISSDDGDHWTTSSIINPPSEINNGKLYAIGGSDGLFVQPSKKIRSRTGVEASATKA